MRSIIKCATALALSAVMVIGTIGPSAYAKDEDVLKGASQKNGHYYRLFDYGMTWNQANNFCKAMDGHLVTITSKEEQDVVEKLLKKGKKNSYWAGGYRNSKGELEWVTKEAFDQYSNWASFQPDNYAGEEDKIMLYRNANPRSTSSLGNWNDIKADGTCNNEDFFGKSNFGFICEWESKKDAEQIDIDETSIKISKSSYTYTGKAVKPTVTATFCGYKLKQNKDFTVTYKNNKNVGKATVVIKGKGDFDDTVKLTFKISPAKVKGLSVKKAGSAKASVSWKKESSGAGYEVQYSKSSSFANSKVKKVTNKNTTKTTIKGLESGKKYYVRIRAYKNVGGKTYYSSWSSSKKVNM